MPGLLLSPSELRAVLNSKMAPRTFQVHQKAGAFNDLLVAPRYRVGKHKYSRVLVEKRYGPIGGAK